MNKENTSNIVSPIQDIGTPEQKAKRLVEEEKVKAQRLFVKDKFFPILCEATDSINDADIFLQTFSTMLMDVFLGLMKEKKFVELNLIDKLDKNSPKFEVIKRLISSFDDMNVKDAQSIIEGMKQELRKFYTDEMKTRKLESLTVNWL